MAYARDSVTSGDPQHHSDQLAPGVTVGSCDFGLPAQRLSTRTCSTCPANRSCRCFSLDLARVRLDAFRGVLDAGVGPLADSLGNLSDPANVVRDRALAKQCGRGVGLLYIAVRTDSALTAVVVDSPGLDGTAPWPRFHHDNGNTGNPETPLTPWSCP